MQNEKFFNALIVSDMKNFMRSFCIHEAKCIQRAKDYSIFNCPCKERFKDIEYVLCENNHLAR